MKIIAQGCLAQPAVARSSATVTGKLTDGPFNTITLMHRFLESLRLHLPATLLQVIVMFSNEKPAATVTGLRALSFKWTSITMITPFETVIHLARLMVFQATALRTRMAGRAYRLTLRNRSNRGQPLNYDSAEKALKQSMSPVILAQ